MHQLKPNKGARRTSKRVGRGLGSKGTYSGRGTKGQRARAGGRSGLQLKGLRRILLAQPKSRGFQSQYPKVATVSLTDLSRAFKSGEKVTPEALLKKELIRDTKAGVKVLGTGSISVKLTIQGCSVSAGAKDKIEKAGGTIA